MHWSLGECHGSPGSRWSVGEGITILNDIFVGPMLIAA